MKRTFMALACILGLGVSACGLSLPDPGKAPAPLEHTVIDEDALNLAVDAFDLALYGVDAVVASGKLTPGSPAALQVKSAIIRVRASLNAASNFREAGSTAGYAEAVRAARVGIACISEAIKGKVSDQCPK